MFDWYKNAFICYAYLEDVRFSKNASPSHILLAPSRWFGRGWTLQGLLAPLTVRFYDGEWNEIGYRTQLTEIISLITNIDKVYLFDRLRRGTGNLGTASIAERMSWAACCETTREEDIAYCLLGIFGINMPLLYGEGKRAFLRLQEELIKKSDDQTIFAWQFGLLSDKRDFNSYSGLLASSPAYFKDLGHLVPCQIGNKTPAFSMSNKGLEITLPLLDDHAILACQLREEPTLLMVVRLHYLYDNVYQRRSSESLGCVDLRAWRQWKKVKICVTTTAQTYPSMGYRKDRRCSFTIRQLPPTSESRATRRVTTSVPSGFIFLRVPSNWRTLGTRPHSSEP
jgi:hypothetical protein